MQAFAEFNQTHGPVGPHYSCYLMASNHAASSAITDLLHMYVYVYTYIYVYVYTYIYIYIYYLYSFVSMYTYMCMCMFICMYVCMYICIRMRDIFPSRLIAVLKMSALHRRTLFSTTSEASLWTKKQC